MEVALRRADVSEGDSRAGSFFLSLSLRTDEGGRNVKRAGANERRRHATGEQKKKGWRNSGKLCVAVSTNAYALENTLGGGTAVDPGRKKKSMQRASSKNVRGTTRGTVSLRHGLGYVLEGSDGTGAWVVPPPGYLPQLEGQERRRSHWKGHT